MSEGRVGLVTGTGRGLGRALAEHFCARGDQVVGCSRGEATWTHPGYTHVQADISDEAQAIQLVRRVRDLHGRLDYLVNNAGVARMNHFLLTPGETVRDVFATNFLGTFLVSREAGKLMAKHKQGRIVNLSTVAVPLKLEGEAAYASSKAAVNTLTQILARELAPLGITCNAVGPGPIETDLIRNVPPEKIERLLASLSIHRLTRFADVIHVVEFFLAAESDLVTGQVLYLGGA